jgi:hypothetical protein
LPPLPNLDDSDEEEENIILTMHENALGID